MNYNRYSWTKLPKRESSKSKDTEVEVDVVSASTCLSPISGLISWQTSWPGSLTSTNERRSPVNNKYITNYISSKNHITYLIIFGWFSPRIKLFFHPPVSIFQEYRIRTSNWFYYSCDQFSWSRLNYQVPYF